jgi:Extended Signal Peptide of Type V secretion system
MNCSIHRTIYNRKRGCLMAVAETANSSGKASGGVTTRRKARSVLPSGDMWLQANHSKGYSLPCLQSQWGLGGNGVLNLNAGGNINVTAANIVNQGSGQTSLTSMGNITATAAQIAVTGNLNLNAAGGLPSTGLCYRR